MASSFTGKCRGKLLAEHEKKMQDNWCGLKENIESDTGILIDRFFQISLIDTTVKKRLQNCNETEKAEKLLNIVMDSGPDGYERFLKCLKETGFTGAVRLLEPECKSGDCVAEHIEKTGNEREVRIVLIGKTGVGKSSLGNTLLHLLGDDKFISDVGAGSITESNLLKERVTRVDKENILLKVLDTPGLSDTRKSNTETATVLVRCINDLDPGPHVFVFVFKIDRIDDSVMTNIEYLKDIFGVCLEKYGVIVFTGKDHLEEKPFVKYLETATPEFKDFLSNYCKDRFAVINNKQHNKQDVEDIIKLIMKTIEGNGCDCYRNEMYEEAKNMYEEKLRVIEEEKVKVEKELQDQLNQEKMDKEQLKNKYEERLERETKEKELLQNNFKERLAQEIKEKDKVKDQLNREKTEKEQLKNDLEEEKARVKKEFEDQLSCLKRENEQLTYNFKKRLDQETKEKESLQKRLNDADKLKEENKTLKDNYQQLVKEHEQNNSLKDDNQNLSDENMALKLDKVYHTESTIKSYVEVLRTSGRLKNLDLVELCEQLLSRGYLDANDKSEVIESKTPVDTIDKLMKILKTKDRNQNVEAYIIIVKYLGNEMPNLENDYADPFDSNENDDTDNSDNISHHDDSRIIEHDESDTIDKSDNIGSQDSTNTHDTIDANDTIEDTPIIEHIRDMENTNHAPHSDSPSGSEYIRDFPLHHAALDCPDLDSFRSVLTVYSDKIHSLDADGNTPLEKAFQSSCFMEDKVKLLLLERYDKGKANPLIKLIETAPTDLVELIFNMRSNNNQIKDFNLTIAELRQLLEKGGDIKSKTRYNIRNRSLLHLACALASLESVKYLIDEGCEVKRRDSEGLTPLCHCCWFDVDLIRKVKLLLSRGARYNKIDAVSLCNNAAMRIGEGSNTVIHLRRIFGIK